MADQKPPKDDKPIEDLLNKDDRMMKSPLLWFVLLLIPVAISFYVGITTSSGADNSKGTEIVQYDPPPVEGGLSGTGRRPAPPEDCEFGDWVGKPVDEAMEGQIKAQKRPYRILPPGSMMTMDHSPARVNFDVDEGGKITRVWCG